METWLTKFGAHNDVEVSRCWFDFLGLQGQNLRQTVESGQT